MDLIVREINAHATGRLVRLTGDVDDLTTDTFPEKLPIHPLQALHRAMVLTYN